MYENMKFVYKDNKSHVILDNDEISNQPVDINTYTDYVHGGKYDNYNKYHTDSKYLVIKHSAISNFMKITKKEHADMMIIPYDTIYYYVEDTKYSKNKVPCIFATFKTHAHIMSLVNTPNHGPMIKIWYSDGLPNNYKSFKQNDSTFIMLDEYDQWCDQFRTIYMCLKWRNRQIQRIGTGVIKIICEML